MMRELRKECGSPFSSTIMVHQSSQFERNVQSRKNCTGRKLYRPVQFGCEKCTGLAKSVQGSEKGPLAILDVGIKCSAMFIMCYTQFTEIKTRSLEITAVYSWCM